MTAQPALLWSGEARHPEPGSRGQWRVVITETQVFNGYSHDPEPRLVVERAIEQASLGEPVWQRAESLPADVLLELLWSQLPPPIEEQVRALFLAGDAA